MEPVAPKRILVIDDEANVRIVVQTCLEILGEWEVLLAASGQEGLLLTQTKKPDAILLDVMMPGMDGVAFVRELQANPELRAIPVVFLTAKAELTQPRQFQALGVSGAIAKPFNPLTLHDQIATSLGWDKAVVSISPLTRASN
jgi:CheY-like chemotaxis protein